MTTQKVQAPPVNLKERIAAFQQRNVQQRQPSSPLSGPSSNHGGGLRDKIAQFEQKGAVPAPRGSFGLGAPPISDGGQTRRKGELYGNRIPGVVRSTGGSRSTSPLPSGTPERRNRRVSEDYDARSPDGSPTYEFVPSPSANSPSGEPGSPPQSPSFPPTAFYTDYPPPRSSSLSPRRSSFANALEIARRAENTSPIGKYDTRDTSLPRPVSPFLAQRLPSLIFSEEEETPLTPKKPAHSRKSSLVVATLPSNADRITDLHTEVSEPEQSPSLQKESTQDRVCEEPSAAPEPIVSLLPVEEPEVTRMSFEEMLAAFGGEEPIPPASVEPANHPAEERASESIDPHEGPSPSPPSDVSKPEEADEPCSGIDTIPNHIPPEITIVSFEDVTTPLDIKENRAEDLPPTEFTEKTIIVEESDVPITIPIIEVPSPEPEDEAIMPVAPVTHEVNYSPKPSLEVSSHADDISGEKDIPVGEAIPTTQSPVVSPQESESEAELLHSPVSQELSTDSTESSKERIIRDSHTWQDRLPHIKIELANVSEGIEIVNDLPSSAASFGPEPDLHDVATTREAIHPSNTPISPEHPTSPDTPPHSSSSHSYLSSSPLYSPSPSLTMDPAYLTPESPVRPRAISMVEEREAKEALARRVSSMTSRTAPYGDTRSAETEVGSEFGRGSTHTHSYFHPPASRSPYGEEFEFGGGLRVSESKPISFSAVVHGKVTEMPPTSGPSSSYRGGVPSGPHPARTRLTASANVEPESPGYMELAELLEEAAKLEKRLLEGDIPSEHRAAARQSLQAMSKYATGQERFYMRQKSSVRAGGEQQPQQQRPLYHRASSSPSAVKTVQRSRSGDGGRLSRVSEWNPIARKSTDLPPVPPPKSPRTRYFGGGYYRKMGNNVSIAGGQPRESLSTSSELSSEDSVPGGGGGGGSDLESVARNGRRGVVHKRSGSMLGIGWPSMPQKKHGSGGIGLAVSFAEKIWKRGRTKSTTSMSDVSESSVPPRLPPPLIVAAAFNDKEITPTPVVGQADGPSGVPDERPVSWASGASTSSSGGSGLGKELFDAFPCVPQDMPVIVDGMTATMTTGTATVTGTMRMASGPLPPPPLVGPNRPQVESTYKHRKALSRSATMPIGPRAITSAKNSARRDGEVL